MKKKIVIILVIVTLFWILAYRNSYLDNYKIEETYVNWTSMLPALFNWEKVNLIRNYYDYNEVKRWDMIWFNLKKSWNYVKRIIAIPKDKIIFWKDWYLYINGILQKENYIPSRQKFSINRLSLLLKQLESYENVIPENMYLILWDNRLKSKDSTWFWLISKDQIIWKVEKR